MADGLDLKDVSEAGDKVIVSDHHGKVCLHFEKPIEWLALDPQVAGPLGEELARRAYRAKWGDHPTTMDRSQITEQMRVRMRNRVSIMLRSFFSQPTQFDVMASQIVDTIFSECM